MTKPEIIAPFRRYGSFEKLTPSEKKTLTLVKKGMTRQQMADDLKIGIKTLHNRLYAIKQKLEAKG